MLGVATAIRTHADAFRPIFTYNPKQLMAEDMERLFVINRSKTENEDRKKAENNTVGFWRDFLVDLEGEHHE